MKIEVNSVIDRVETFLNKHKEMGTRKITSLPPDVSLYLDDLRIVLELAKGEKNKMNKEIGDIAYNEITKTRDDLRKRELKEVKKVIKEYLTEDTAGGIFNKQGLCDDDRIVIYVGNVFTLFLCDEDYFELFGTTSYEFKEVKDYYNKLVQKLGDEN